MSYEIIFTDTSRRQFNKLEKSVKERIIAALERIRIRPEVHVKKLVGDPGYRLRVGDYRVIFDVQNNLIRILKIGHRKKIYK